MHSHSNLAQAELSGLNKSLNLHGVEFNTATSILFVGYLLMQLPSNLILTRLRPSLYLPGCMIIWGTIAGAQASLHEYKSLVVTRFFLGFAEAPYFPGAVFLMSVWYTRAELNKRFAFFYAGPALSNMFGGLLAAGVLEKLEGVNGLAGWRWLFIIECAMTIFIALISFFSLPDFPSTTRWLSEEERAYSEWRIMKDIGSQNSDYQEPRMLKSALLAVQDWRTWLFVLMQHGILLSQTVTFFFPSVVSTLGYDHVETLLLTAPVWTATFICNLLILWSASRTKERCFHMIGSMCLTIIGNIILISVHLRGPRFFGMFLMAMGAQPAFMIILAWIPNTFPRPLGKRAAIIAIVNMIGNTSNIYGAYLYPSSAAPQYVFGGATIAGVGVVCCGLALAMRFALKKENQKIDVFEQEIAQGRAEEALHAAPTFKGDNERIALARKGFRYLY